TGSSKALWGFCGTLGSTMAGETNPRGRRWPYDAALRDVFPPAVSCHTYRRRNPGAWSLVYSMSSQKKRIRKAVFPVAGLGTRFLPATKAMPKEMLTVVDRPVIQHVVDEARAAGIEHFIFVTGRGKGVIEDHFDIQFELERTLAERGKQKELE